MTPIEMADAYRDYSRAIRFMSDLQGCDLKIKSRVISYLYKQGNVFWLQLVKLDCGTFGRAFDASRRKDVKGGK